MVESKDSFYGKVTVLKNDEEYDFYENSNKITSTEPLSKNEEIVHIPLLLLNKPENVLVIGGSMNKLPEILKHNVKKVVYVEPNPVFYELSKKYSGKTIRDVLNDSRIVSVREDGRFFIKRTKEKYDCIILDVPPPVTGLSNRYFTVEFFSEIKNILSEDGIVIISFLSSENYMSDELKYLNASVYKTINSVFPYCYVMPASYNYFICSSRKRDINPVTFIKKLERGKIKTKYLYPYYVRYILRDDRTDRVVNWINEKRNDVLCNYDFYPICYFYGLNYWISYFGKKLPGKLFTPPFGFIYFCVSLIYVVFLIFFVKLKKYYFETVITIVSCFSMVLELLIIFAFQSIYGYVYYKIGILLSLCLLGIGTGSYLSNKFLTKREKFSIVRIILFSMLFFSLMLPFLFKMLYHKQFVEPIFYVLILSAGLFTGLIFSIVVNNDSNLPVGQADMHGEKVGKFYGLDLLGSMFGSVSASLILIPMFGIINTCFLAALFILFLIFF
ncbi:MAG: hypothetical protein PHE88_02570 [Elusimicrobia bacterium]|nr:hypothetical protein [Elusimicrobiota bacterium]